MKKKTHRGAAKRFRVTASGKVKRSHASKSHLNGGKRRKELRYLKKKDYVDSTQAKLIRSVI
ncbi:MAG: 50S ribosomal protein L35 [Elusimicrobia bacterium HGW-Elusimicrobia-2]|nr:MAG: 50S ribosomal protein L35 [Elusimicrobia bacterium HGW-Elusimicrobia-2]